MNTLKIHTEGQVDHLKALNDMYDELKKFIKHNSKLNQEQKHKALKKINEEFILEKKDSNHKMF